MKNRKRKTSAAPPGQQKSRKAEKEVEKAASVYPPQSPGKVEMPVAVVPETPEATLRQDPPLLESNARKTAAHSFISFSQPTRNSQPRLKGWRPPIKGPSVQKQQVTEVCTRGKENLVARKKARVTFTGSLLKLVNQKEGIAYSGIAAEGKASRSTTVSDGERVDIVQENGSACTQRSVQNPVTEDGLQQRADDNESFQQQLEVPEDLRQEGDAHSPDESRCATTVSEEKNKLEIGKEEEGRPQFQKLETAGLPATPTIKNSQDCVGRDYDVTDEDENHSSSRSCDVKPVPDCDKTEETVRLDEECSAHEDQSPNHDSTSANNEIEDTSEENPSPEHSREIPQNAGTPEERESSRDLQQDSCSDLNGRETAKTVAPSAHEIGDVDIFAEMNGDIDISESQLTELENEVQLGRVHSTSSRQMTPYMADNFNTRRGSSANFISTSMAPPLQIPRSTLNQRRQGERLRAIIKEVSRLNALVIRIKKDVVNQRF